VATRAEREAALMRFCEEDLRAARHELLNLLDGGDLRMDGLDPLVRRIIERCAEDRALCEGLLLMEPE
jgi:hypothetical protein